MMRIRFVASFIALAIAASDAPRLLAQAADTRPAQYRPMGTPLELGLAGFAKVVCSAVYVSGRDAAEAARNSGHLLMPSEEAAAKATSSIDRDQKIVRMSSEGITREARFYGDQGCIIHKPERPGRQIFFTPVPVRTTLPDAASQAWPMGDRAESPPLPPEVDRAKVDAALDAAFADPNALTAGFIAVYKGRIIAERYMPGITKDTQLESWSMGKSIVSTLFALLVKDGTYRLDQPAPVPEWQSADDPRKNIQTTHLLRMSSGLRFIATQDPDYTPDKGYPDHFYMYTGAVNAYDYSAHQPLQFPPNTEGRYRNSDPLTLMYLAKLAVTKRGEEFLTWPQRALFDRIGIRRQVLETDPVRQLPVDRVRLRHAAQLGAARPAVSPGWRLAGNTDPSRGLVQVCEHARARVEAPGVRRSVLGERRRRVEHSQGRLPHVRRGRTEHLRDSISPARGRAHGPRAR